ncbi:MAG TPA: hypothetical protein VMA73_03355, partial [Streptosporangiaceae bacterium]|nr:hypothetical protein [Streptosporangiaceae bacterium]
AMPAPLSRSVGAMRSGYPDKAFVSVPSFGDVRGVPSYEPALQITLKVVTAGLPDGASALFLVTGQVQAASGRMADLGTAEPVFEQLSYGPDQPREFDSQVRWRLSSAGVERLEQLRAGGGFTMSVGVRYGLLGGTGAPDWREPHRPVRVPYPDQPVQVIIKAHDWVQNVLEPMQQAAAVSLVVALPQGRTTDDHRTIVVRLADAKRELEAGNWKPSIAASREACELLRKMRPATINPKPQQRELPERGAVILTKLCEFTQALFDHDSAASHPDERLRDIAWNRENAVLALGTAASLVQLIFALP